MPAALMVWQDGQNLIQRDGATRAQIVFDNLTHQNKIPVIIHLFISPGKVGEKAMRSIEYDTVSDRYAQFLRDGHCSTGGEATFSSRHAIQLTDDRCVAGDEDMTRNSCSARWRR